MVLQVRTVAIDDPGPLLDVIPDVPASQRLAFVRDGEGLVGWGSAHRIEVRPTARPMSAADADLRAIAARSVIHDEVEARGSGLVAFGSFCFDPWNARGSVLIIPEMIVGRHEGRAWRTTCTLGSEQALSNDVAADPQSAAQRDGSLSDRPRFAGSSLRDDAWLVAVADALDEIAAGQYEKVVLARDRSLWSRSPFDVPRILARLADRFPDCATFCVDGLIGASPETLVERTGRGVRSVVLAGTVARDEDAAVDAQLARGLLTSTKDLREHSLAVASVQQALGPVCGALHTDGPRLLGLHNVQHLATEFIGRLHDDTSSLALAQLLHPTAAVGGTPRAEALEASARLEQLDRGRYAAPVGWTDASGDGEWAIALRCAEIDGTRARLFAGAGVVAGSRPEDELQETWLKLGAMQDALGDSSEARQQRLGPW